MRMSERIFDRNYRNSAKLQAQECFRFAGKFKSRQSFCIKLFADEAFEDENNYCRNISGHFPFGHTFFLMPFLYFCLKQYFDRNVCRVSKYCCGVYFSNVTLSEKKLLSARSFLYITQRVAKCVFQSGTYIFISRFLVYEKNLRISLSHHKDESDNW